MAERDEHPHSAEYEHHNEHDGDDDQDELNHNPVRAALPFYTKLCATSHSLALSAV
jgi:hypothetical protein